MKRLVFIAVAMAIISCAAAQASYVIWKKTDPPPVSLSAALALAEENMAAEDVQYFCIGASLAKTFSDGDWAITFSSKEGKVMTVNVASDKKITKGAEFRY